MYLDYSATTPPYEEVTATFLEVSKRYFANPASLHQQGMEVEKLATAAKQQIADLLAVQRDELTVTSGGSESNNLAIKGIAMKYIGQRKRIITTAIEHPSVLEPLKQLRAFGFDIVQLPVDETGVVSLTALRESLTKDTVLVSIMAVNNEIGTKQPIAEIAEILRDERALLHVDYVQAVGKMAIDLRGVDLASFSAHKFHGIKGTGLLYVRSGVDLQPLIAGGDQQPFRSGTEFVAGTVAMAKALRLTLQSWEEEAEKVAQQSLQLREQLTKLAGVQLHHFPTCIPHIIHFSIAGMKPEVVIQALGKQGFALSSTSACSAKAAKPSHVLQAIGIERERAKQSLRISFGPRFERLNIASFMAALQTALAYMPRS